MYTESSIFQLVRRRLRGSHQYVSLGALLYAVYQRQSGIGMLRNCRLNPHDADGVGGS